MCVYVLTCMLCTYIRLKEPHSKKYTSTHTVYTSKRACVLNSCLLRGQDGDSNSATANQTNLQSARAICGIRR